MFFSSRHKSLGDTMKYNLTLLLHGLAELFSFNPLISIQECYGKCVYRFVAEWRWETLPHPTSCFLGAIDSSYINAIIDCIVIKLYHKTSQYKFSPPFIGGPKWHVTVGWKESVAWRVTPRVVYRLIFTISKLKYKVQRVLKESRKRTPKYTDVIIMCILSEYRFVAVYNSP